MQLANHEGYYYLICPLSTVSKQFKTLLIHTIALVISLPMKLIERCSLHPLHNKIMIFEVRKMRKCCGRGAGRYSTTFPTCIAQQVTLFMPVIFIHFYTLSVRSASNQNTCRMKRTDILLVTWNIPVFHYVFEHRKQLWKLSQWRLQCSYFRKTENEKGFLSFHPSPGFPFPSRSP